MVYCKRSRKENRGREKAKNKRKEEQSISRRHSVKKITKKSAWGLGCLPTDGDMPLISPSSSLTNQFVFEEAEYNFTWAMYDKEEDDKEQLERDEVYGITSYVENEAGIIEQYGNMFNSEGIMPPE